MANQIYRIKIIVVFCEVSCRCTLAWQADEKNLSSKFNSFVDLFIYSDRTTFYIL